ncbi:MAG: ABC transporter ATP-binding protein [Candidatus Brocadiia bacterium]
MINIEEVYKTYGSGEMTTPVLKDVTFSIEAGEYVAIMGASGTGKSTLMNILGCLDKPTQGHYRLEGTDMISLDDEGLSHVRNEKIGFVFQTFHLLERTTAAQNVMLPLIYAQRYPDDATERAEQALTEVGLQDRVSYRPNELSGGQQQRVAIARALVTDPDVILADEPSGNLDSQSELEILRVFQKLHAGGRTLIVVTHSKKVAEHAERVIELEDGRIVGDHAVEQRRDASQELEQTQAKEVAK